MRIFYTLVFLTVFSLNSIAQNVQMQGIAEKETLNEDGTALVKMPFKWYAGIATADDRQTAIEMAQREAYATISRIFNNEVSDVAERGTLSDNGMVIKVLASYWEQFSTSVISGCEPFGEADVKYDDEKGLFVAVVKVAIRGDRFVKMLDAAGHYEPENLQGDDLDEFINANKTIIEAAKGELAGNEGIKI